MKMSLIGLGMIGILFSPVSFGICLGIFEDKVTCKVGERYDQDKDLCIKQSLRKCDGLRKEMTPTESRQFGQNISGMTECLEGLSDEELMSDAFYRCSSDLPPDPPYDQCLDSTRSSCMKDLGWL